MIKHIYILQIVFLISMLNGVVFAQGNKQMSKESVGEYVCSPCGQDCDNIVYDKPGTCTHCYMELIKKSAVAFKNIQPTDLCKYISDHPMVVLLDVRTKKEFEEKATPNYGSLKNAINIPIQELGNRLSELSKYKNRKIIVFCSHSQRSPRASLLLTQNGFANVTNMAGGLSALKDNACKNK